jgi:uncharacterized repeat protein (TIGR01451 family)
MLRRLQKLFGFESRLDRRQRLRRGARPIVEWLEDRLVPANVPITVTSIADSTFFNPSTVTVAQVTAKGATVSLRDAINAANNGGGDTIGLATAGHYQLTDADNSTDGANGLPVITSPITINGHGSTISHAIVGATAFRLFDVAPQGSLTLNDMDVLGGLAQGSGSAAQGGGIYFLGKSLTLTNVSIEGNTAQAEGNAAEADGGGLYLGGQGIASLTNVKISGNSAMGGKGSQGAHVTFSQSSFPVGGTGGVGAGGGLYVNGASINLTNAYIGWNGAGGGQGGPGGTPTVNAGKGGYGGQGGQGMGGGLYVNSGSVSLLNATFQWNVARGGQGGTGGTSEKGGNGGLGTGGGIYVAGGTLSLGNATMVTNQAVGGQGGSGGLGKGQSGVGGTGGTGGDAMGGGLFVNAGTVSLTNDTITAADPTLLVTNANSATGGASGDDGGYTTLGGSSGSNGSAGQGMGGGVYIAGGTVSLANDLIANNAAQTSDPNVSGSFTSDHDFIGASATLDLAPLADNNGPQVGSDGTQITLQTIAPQSGSPAITNSSGKPSGDDSAAPAAIDERGFARITGSGISIGAYQGGDAGASPSADLSVAVQAPTPAVVTPGADLSYTVTVTNNSSTNQTNVTLIDTLPADTSFVSWVPANNEASNWQMAGANVGTGNTVTAWIGTLPAGAMAQFILTVAVSNGTVLIDNASVGPVIADPNTANNSAIVKTSVVTQPPTHLVLRNTPTTSITAGDTLNTFKVFVVDSNGKAVTGDNADQVILTVSRIGFGIASVRQTVVEPVIDGVAIFKGLTIKQAGSTTLSAAVSGLPTITTSPFTVNPGAASQLVFQQQPVSATAGKAVPGQLEGVGVDVALEDKYGNVETGISSGTISVGIASGPLGAGFTSSSSTTASVVNGVAAFTNLVLDTAGSYTLTATSSTSGVSAATSVAFTVSPAAASQLVFTLYPAGIFVPTAGSWLAPGVQVSVEDPYGNVVTSADPLITVSIASGPKGARFTAKSDLSVGAVNGVANFDNLVLTTSGTYTLKATALNSSLTAATSGSFTVQPAAPGKLVLLTQPGDVTAGRTLSTIKVALEDSYGNLESSNSTAQITMSIASGPSGSAFTSSSTTTATVASGVATFSNLVLDTAGSYTLKATTATTGVASATSSAFTVSAASASQLAFTSVPSSANAGGAFVLTVAVEDKYGNAVNADNGSQAALSIASGPKGVSFASGNTTATISNGVASFTNLVLYTDGSYELKATCGTLTAASATLKIKPQQVQNVAILPGSLVPVGNPGGLRNTYRLTVTITASSNGGGPLNGPVALWLPNISSTNLTNKTGTYQNSPYVDLPAADLPLASGQSLTVTLNFLQNPGNNPLAGAEVLQGF